VTSESLNIFKGNLERKTAIVKSDGSVYRQLMLQDLLTPSRFSDALFGKLSGPVSNSVWRWQKSVVSVVSCRFPNSITTTCWQLVADLL